jgi:hypothetical protein
MKTKISKSQREVWEWKELLYEELKSVPPNMQLEYIHQKVKKTLEDIKRKKKKVNRDNKE